MKCPLGKAQQFGVATVGEKELCICTLDDLAENTRSHIGKRIWIEAEWN